MAYALECLLCLGQRRDRLIEGGKKVFLERKFVAWGKVSWTLSHESIIGTFWINAELLLNSLSNLQSVNCYNFSPDGYLLVSQKVLQKLVRSHVSPGGDLSHSHKILHNSLRWRLLGVNLHCGMIAKWNSI